MKKKIVIVGGGYVGFEVAKALEPHADVTLIEQREAFVHPPAAIRALVDPSLLKQIVIPYDKLLRKGRVLRARVEKVGPDGVTLADGTEVAADFVLIATGSSYAAPFKPAGSSAAEFVEANKDVSEKLAAAKTVAIVGAGAVGTELAGEIASAQRGTKITLISSLPHLFPDYPKKLGLQLQEKLEAKGVTVILGQRAQDLVQTDGPYAGAVTLTDGRVIDADLIFPVVGSRPQSELLAELPGVQRQSSGRYKTDRWLRPSTLPNVFAAGDIVDIGDGMTIVAISRQNPWLVKTLKAAVQGEKVEDQKPYTPWKRAPILLPLGRDHGNSWLFAVFGNRVTSMMKGKQIFIPKYRKALGYRGHQ